MSKPKVLLGVLLAVGVGALRWWQQVPPPAPRALPLPSASAAAAAATAPAADQSLRDAFARQARNVPVEITAVVTKLMKDDREGLQHQRFLVRAAGLTILVAHNTDLAPRVPVQLGDTIRIRGEYVWNVQRGLLHWTHRDPRGRHAAGFIEVRGQRIQ